MPSDEEIRSEVHRLVCSLRMDADRSLAAVLSGTRAVRRRRLVPLAAAVSVLAVVAGGFALSGVLSGNDAEPDRVAPDVPALSDGTPEGTVPSIFGHTKESATELLEERGLQVRFGEKDSCQTEGRPVGTRPDVGTPVEPGDTVTVLIAFVGPLTDCAYTDQDAWPFVDFANGRGPAPAFADEVSLYVDGEPTTTLSADEARGGEWGEDSALSILAQASDEVVRDGNSYLTPSLGVIRGTPPDAWCGIARPDALGEREAMTLTIDFEDAETGERCPARVSVYETGGAIDAVVAWSESATGGGVTPIPDVVGLPLDEARAAVTAAGYTARVEELEICNPREGIVVEQAPSQQDVDDDAVYPSGYPGPVTLVVEVPHSTRNCAGLDAAAADFLEFARGGPPPDWAPEVQQLFGYAEWDTITGDRADDPDAWSFCSGLGPDDCQLSPLVVAGRDVEVATGEFADVSRWPSGEHCELIDNGGLPDGLYEGQIVLFPAELTSCDDDWSVWLWVDGEGRIEAVNLLVPQ